MTWDWNADQKIHKTNKICASDLRATIVAVKIKVIDYTDAYLDEKLITN